ncbi:hypothetical protein [Halorubrum sp. FL23]|uniref:hypothetical protein n=1 Tax=Halorubrum sp. FL23 TaxID=3458704 RepID=UPI004034CBC5
MRFLEQNATVLVVVMLIVASLTLTAPVAGQSGIDTSNLEIGEPAGPSEIEVGDEMTLTSSASIRSLPADWTAEVDFTAYANGNEVGTQKVSLEDGESVDISVTHSFEETGSKDLHFEITGELTRKGAIAEQTTTIDRTTRSVSVTVVDGNESDTEETQNNTESADDKPDAEEAQSDTESGDDETNAEETESDTWSVGDELDDATSTFGTRITTEGAVFVAPESVQSQVDNVRENVPLGADPVPYAFVLATSEGLHLVLSDKKPKEGYASVEGIESDREGISIDRDGTADLELTPVLSREVEYQDPSKASIKEVSQDPDDYRREFVEFTANHRSIALDDEQSEYKATVGVLVDDPLSSEELFGTLGEHSSTTLKEAEDETTGSVLGDYSQPHIVTTAYGTETDYWENTAVRMSGIVATPQSPAGEFIQSQQQFNTLATDQGTPILYVIDEEHDAQQESIADLSTNPAAYEGDTVRFESNLYMNTISSKRVIESTGTKMPPVDTVLHGGVAWNTLPDNRDDLIGVVAASSITQKQLSEVRKGTYEVTGEVVPASTIDGHGSQGVVVLAYNLEKTGSLESASVSDLVTQESTGLSAMLERQANPTQDVSTITQSGEDAVEAAGESGNESTDEVTSQDGSDDAAETADESDNESTGEDTDQDDSEAASETSNGAETQSESSLEETENTEASESDTTQSTESDEGNGVMGSISELIQLFTDLIS